jgi:hypothetical protein
MEANYVIVELRCRNINYMTNEDKKKIRSKTKEEIMGNKEYDYQNYHYYAMFSSSLSVLQFAITHTHTHLKIIP